MRRNCLFSHTDTALDFHRTINRKYHRSSDPHISAIFTLCLHSDNWLRLYLPDSSGSRGLAGLWAGGSHASEAITD